MPNKADILAKTGVVITNYNKKEYILEAIESALAQTKNVIVVDDCSSDGSRELIEASKCKHVLLHDENSGASKANITGISKAIELGWEFVTTLDGDDVLAGNALDYYSSVFAETGADAIISDGKRSSHEDSRGLVEDCNMNAELVIYDDPLDFWMKRGKGGSCLCARATTLIANIDPDLFVQDHQMAFSIHYNSKRVVYSAAFTHFCSAGVQENNLSTNQLAKVQSYAGQYVYHYPLIKSHPKLKFYTHRAFHKALGARKLAENIGKPYAFYLKVLRIFRDFIPHSARISIIREVDRRLKNST